MILAFQGKVPQLGSTVFIADNATVLGDVSIGDRSSIWYGTVIRGDVQKITIGNNTNIQDCCVVHVTTETCPTKIGDDVTVGHGAIIHGCTIKGLAMIGMGAIIMDGAIVEQECVVGAGSLIAPGQTFPAGSLIIGSPARVKREISDEERHWIRQSAEQYAQLAQEHVSSAI